ncbi:MAG: transposase [Verrucomicrobia bacterium]|nr:transposase [Verrucomicrobiota bacterium]MCH8514139.1 transposase [Kiritimatiellia bacterium]
MNITEKLCTVGTPFLQNRKVSPETAFRGYLPHELGRGLVQHVILHLSDSMPAKALERMRREVAHLSEDEAKRELEEKVEAWSDAGHGCCALRQPANANKMRDTLLHFHEVRYRLFAWVVMPNHVHVLFQTFPGWPLERVVNGWKKNSATEILKDHQPLPRPFWEREYWDRYIRNPRHFRKTVEYIHQNPVKARLVRHAEDWTWSTARAWAPFWG